MTDICILPLAHLIVVKMKVPEKCDAMPMFRIGRRPVLLFSLMTLSVTGAASVLADSIHVFTFGRFLQGICSPVIVAIQNIFLEQCVQQFILKYSTFIIESLKRDHPSSSFPPPFPSSPKQLLHLSQKQILTNTQPNTPLLSKTTLSLLNALLYFSSTCD